MKKKIKNKQTLQESLRRFGHMLARPFKMKNKTLDRKLKHKKKYEYQL